MTPLMWELEAFCAVVDRQSFVAAARQLGRSPSAITRAIQTLEAQIGQELLKRSQKLVSPTAAGETYYTYASDILALHREATERLVAGEARAEGWIRFSAPETLALYRLPEILAQFARHYPEIHVDVRYTDVAVDPIKENLDFAIRGAFPQSSELRAFPLWNYTRHLYASPDYLERYGLPHTPQELDAHGFLIHTAPRVLHDWTLRRGNETYRLKWRASHRISSGIALVRAAIGGMGVARLADWLCADALATGKLVQLLPDWRLTSSTGRDPQMHAVYAGNRLPQRARLFLNALRGTADNSSSSKYPPAKPGALIC